MARDTWVRRWRQRWHRDTLETRLDDEIQFHLDQEIARSIKGGMNAAEARRAAVRKFGVQEMVKDRTREEFRFARVRERLRDLRLAARGLRRSPGFTATAVLTLALGIGSTTAIFSVVYGVLLRPLPFPDPDRLVALYHVTPASRTDVQGAAQYFTYREQGRVFVDIGLWTGANVSVVRNGAPEQVPVLRVTDGTLSLLGVRPTLGRLIGKEDDRPRTPLRAMLAHAYWQQTFGGATDVIGRSIAIDGRPYEIIGVLPVSFKLPGTDPQLVLPLRLDRATTVIDGLFMNGLARLKPGATIADANADIARMIPLTSQQFGLMPGLTKAMWDAVGLAPNVRPFSEAVIGEMNRPLWILFGTVGIVLLMAWANVANLLMVRAEGRRREFVVRSALGASRRRMVFELLSESLVLGLTGGAFGVLFAQGAIGLLRVMAPAALPRLEEIRIDGVVLLVTLAIAVVTSLLFGLIPALRLRDLDANVLKEGGRSASDGPGRHRMRNTLVVAQVALALVLLTSAALMARTFAAMRHVQPGFVRPTEVQTFSVSLPAALIRDRRQVLQTFEQMGEGLARVPGVTSVGLVGNITMAGRTGKMPLYVEGQTFAGLPPTRSARNVGPGYFETMGNRIVAGRTITWTDVFEFTPVVVVSENLAREHWGDPAKAIGRRVRAFSNDPWQEIVGVVGDERVDGLNRPAPAIIYFPMASKDAVSRSMTFVVRSSRVGASGFPRELQQAVWSVNPNVPLAGMKTLDHIMSASMAQTSFAMVMLVIAAGGAILLALVGIYGVVSYVVAERTIEIGIRMALGAHGGDVRRLFLRRGLALTLVGLSIGIGAAMLLTPIMAALLYGVRPTDPLTYAGVAITLGTVTLVATYVPARRASRVNPIVALRSGH